MFFILDLGMYVVDGECFFTERLSEVLTYGGEIPTRSPIFHWKDSPRGTHGKQVSRRSAPLPFEMQIPKIQN